MKSCKKFTCPHRHELKLSVSVSIGMKAIGYLLTFFMIGIFLKVEWLPILLIPA